MLKIRIFCFLLVYGAGHYLTQNNHLYHMMANWLSWKLNERIGNKGSFWLTFDAARWRQWHAQKSQYDNAKCELHGEWMALLGTRDLQEKARNKS